MRKSSMVWTLLSLIILLDSQAFAIEKPKIAWLISGKQSGFWPVVEQFCNAAADDLKINLQTYYFGNNPVRMVEIAEDILAQKASRPDAIRC